MGFQPSIPIERAHRRRRPWKRWLLLATLLVAGTVVLFSLRPSREPSHDGIPLSEYLPGLIRPETSTNYVIAREALEAMGTNALPAIIGIIRSHDRHFAEFYLAHEAKLPDAIDALIRQKFDPWERRYRYQGALLAVGVLGTNAATAAEALVAELPAAPTQELGRYAESLSKVGPAIIPPIKPLLSNPDETIRRMATFICYQNAQHAADVVPDMINGLAGTTRTHARLVASTLARIGSDAMPFIVQLLTSSDRTELIVGLWASQSVGGPYVAEVWRPSLRLVAHNDPEIRVEAALLNSGRWPLKPAETRRKLESQMNPSVAMADYVDGLKAFENALPGIVSALVEGMNGPNESTRLLCIRELIRRNAALDQVQQVLIDMEASTPTPQQQRQIDQLRERINSSVAE